MSVSDELADDVASRQQSYELPLADHRHPIDILVGQNRRDFGERLLRGDAQHLARHRISNAERRARATDRWLPATPLLKVTAQKRANQFPLAKHSDHASIVGDHRQPADAESYHVAN